MKKKPNYYAFKVSSLSKLKLIMKLISLLILVPLLQVSAVGFSQSAEISIDMKSAYLQDVLEEIERQSEYRFIYKDELVKENVKYNLEMNKKSIEEILNGLFKNSVLTYRLLEDNLVVLAQKDLLSQQIVVQGKVTDTDGEPLPGVNVVENGTANGTVSNLNGEYTISVTSPEATLSFSFVGYLTEDITVGSQTTINIMLVEDIKALEEVVVVGYGTQKKVNLTGSVSAVQNDEIVKRPVSGTSIALQGMIPGMTVIQSSGQPGADFGTIRMRGVGTITTDESVDKLTPLVLVDGMEYNINNVDINDIESVSVLKDAAAASIYGVRAANGVILITTKRGVSDKIGVSYTNNFGWQQPTQLPDFVGAQDYMKLVNLTSTNSGGAEEFSSADIAAYDNPNRDTDLYPDVYWMEEILKGSGFQQEHSLAITGGASKSRYRFSANYVDQKGLLKKTDYERLTVRLNTDVDINDKLSFSGDLAAKLSDRNEPQGNAGGIWFQFSQALQANPTLPVKYSDGTWGICRGDGNPVRNQEEGGKYNYQDNQMAGNFKVNYKLFDGLTISGIALANYSTTFNYLYNQALLYYTDFPDNENSILKGSNDITNTSLKTWNTNFQGLINYSKDFNQHYISVLAGVSRIEETSTYIGVYRNNGSLSDLSEINAGDPDSQTNEGNSYGYGLLSYFGRINYSFMEKYLLEANLRRDGSSRFSEENRWGTFPSFSAGWRISNEPFMESLSFLRELKLRASWGQLGNQEIGYYPYQALMQLGFNYPLGGSLSSGAIMQTYPNSEISWETTTMTNVGVDMLLLEGKINFAFDYYVKNTTGILLNLPIPETVGLDAPQQNAGEVQNRGWELSLGYKGNVGDFKYSARLDLSDVKNEIIDLKDADWEDQDNDNRILAYHVGESIGAFYGYVSEGIFKSEQELNAHATQPSSATGVGDLMYKNIDDSDNEINSNDRTIIGSSIPRYSYGINLASQYKGFDLSIFLQGVGKVDVNTVQINKAPISQDGNFKEMHLESWTADNTGADFPRLVRTTQNYVSSSYWIKSGAYLRLKNIQLGYTIPAPISQKIGIPSLRIFASGQNLLTFSKLNEDGIDPENPQDSRYYPQVKVYTFGINVDF